jgi:hypothetical protein
MTIEQKFSEPQKAILRSKQRNNLFLGGLGSGKTHLLGALTYYFVRYFPEIRGFIGANTFMQLTQSTLFRIREYWKSIGITEYDKHDNPNGFYVVNIQPPDHFNTKNHNFDSYYGIISFVHGAIIFVGSLERSSTHAGKEMGWAVLDETWDTREEDVKEIIMGRIRQKGMYVVNGEILKEGTDKQQYNPLFIATSPAKVQWLNEMFSLGEYIDEIESKIYKHDDYFYKVISNNCVVICSTYHNIGNVGQNYIDNLLQNNSEERGKALVFANPFATSGGEFYSSFSRMQHVKRVEYDPSKPIHVSFDQNTVPYNSALISQVEKVDDNWHLNIIGEVALENPKNSTEEVCEEILRKYGDCSYIFYYGDSTGKNRSTLSKDTKHHYQVIEKALRKKLVNGSNRVLRSNPSHIGKREFVNKIFENKLPIRLNISDICSKLLADLTYIKQDVDGRKKKEIETNKDTGERYEKWGHLSDCLDYKVVSIFNKYYER